MERETQFIGQSAAFQDAVERASLAAALDRPVLVIGERGTGKELIAERLHRLSARWDRPYAIMNCAAMPETLIESELFGHEAGAFTGATRTRAGRFEEADGGTLFLDELATMSMGAQERLLRAVEYGEVTRVGSSRPIRVDVRIVAATNEHLPALVEDNRFRADLLDRLSFEVITLPPLRAREGDIEVLRPLIYCAEEDLQRFSDAMQFPIIPCDLCGSQDGLQRNVTKAMLSDMEKAMPGRKDVMIRALGNINPSHMLDPKLFDFATLSRREA